MMQGTSAHSGTGLSRSLPHARALAYHPDALGASPESLMKIKKLIILCGMAVAAAGALAQTAAPAAADEHAGFVKSVRGTVQLLGTGGTARPARAGDRVGQVDRIVTGADSAASVALRDGTTLVVGPSSRLDLKQFHFDATTQEGGLLVSLLRGSLRMITGLIGKTHPDAVRVETQSATIGIRGTDFIVQADAP